MNILTIETSQNKASLCVCRDGEIVYSTSWETERNHDAFLFPALEQALSLPDTPAPDLILVGAGPGSYGGIRVALAAAVGISVVKESRIAAICSWCGLSDSNTAIISDAKRGGWTIRRPDGTIEVLTIEQLKQELDNGLTIATVEAEETLQKHQLTAKLYQLLPTAESITQAWLNLSPEEQETILNQPAEPIYVRPPHITAAKRKPWEV